MDKPIQTIEIDPKGKYIIAIQSADMDFVRFLQKELRDWWDSNQQFLILYSPDKEEIRFYKAEKDVVDK